MERARQSGLTEDSLRGASWRRVDLGVYVWRAVADSSVVRLKAALWRLPAGAAFCGRSAAWLQGLDFDPCDPIEVKVTTACKVTRLAGISVFRSQAFESSTAQGLPVTSKVQTVVDLARRFPLVEAVSVLDMALHRGLVGVSQLDQWVIANAGSRGVAHLRRALELAEPASESPMETRLRLLLVLAGLPRPRAQTRLRDASGSVIARADLYYSIHRLAIEYDGATHKDSIVVDNRRQNRLFEAGYRMLRFTASDVLGNPSHVVSLVRKAIARPL